MVYIAPEYKKESFTCPYCNVLAQQVWNETNITKLKGNTQFYFCDIYYQNSKNSKKISVSTCQSCKQMHLWYEGKMIVPLKSNVPMAIEGMPEKVKELYNEAREVYPISVKSAAALLRLALQHLCIELGGEGKNINNDIGKLVKEKGLPIQIQQALDSVRVVGNNAVHPGVLDLEDDKTSTEKIFDMLNIIVDNQIIQPKKIEEFYNSLPQGALDGIRNRDSKK